MLEIRESEIQGNGLFTTSKIVADSPIVESHRWWRTDFGHAVNDAEDANAKTVAHDGGAIELVAIRDIAENEEITNNYTESRRILYNRSHRPRA